MSEQIEGVPNGWRLVAIRHAVVGDFFINYLGNPEYWSLRAKSGCRVPIIRKIEQTKQYRPFANAKEFEPHRDRWWRYKEDHSSVKRPPAQYSDTAHHGYDWDYGFTRKEFDDGSPFGLDVTE